MKIAVTGATGFVGSATSTRLRDRGHIVVPVGVSRLRTRARDACALFEEADSATNAAEVSHLVRQIRDVDAVVNCAGLAVPTSSADDALYGANALLPLLLLRACTAAGSEQLVHVSTAAVLGSGVLRDGWETDPQTPYGESKALGEEVLRREGPKAPVKVRILRPTSVHGGRRDVTATLARLARSPLSSVAGTGDHPSPQVLVERVADALETLAVHEDSPDYPVIQPWDGVTVRGVLEDLANGASPMSIPRPFARLIVAAAVSVPHPWVRGQARRVEMLWFGQAHEDGWLTTRGLATKEPDRAAWRTLGEAVTREVDE